MTDVGAASKKGARGKVVEDLRRQILLAFWVVEELPTTFSKPGHALAGLTEKSKGTGSPKRVYTLLQHDWCEMAQDSHHGSPRVTVYPL